MISAQVNLTEQNMLWPTANSLVFDCYDAYREGLCVASYANCHKGCINITTGEAAVPNARLCHSVKDATISIRVGVNGPEHFKSPKKFWIPANTEIIIDYGELFYEHNFK